MRESTWRNPRGSDCAASFWSDTGRTGAACRKRNRGPGPIPCSLGACCRIRGTRVCRRTRASVVELVSQLVVFARGASRCAPTPSHILQHSLQGERSQGRRSWRSQARVTSPSLSGSSGSARRIPAEDRHSSPARRCTTGCRRCSRRGGTHRPSARLPRR